MVSKKVMGMAFTLTAILLSAPAMARDDTLYLPVRISRVVYSLFDKSTFEVSHKELSCSTTYGV